ncbi:MAG: hypothetical protein JWM92_491 [Candidatus Nomurabacteria bacterium]|nr:hypothetical protein [Candidatus Nomurabacteria bacterium]
MFTKSNFLEYKPDAEKPFFVLRMLFVCKNKKQKYLNMENEPVVGEIDQAYLQKHGAEKCRNLLIEHGFMQIDTEDAEKINSIYMPENLVVESE